jgi:glycyl-tRNA synthetase beta chain
MPASVGLDAAGQATPALLKKLAALGADAARAEPAARIDGKSETLFLDAVAAGASLAEGLQRALDRALAQLPIPKVMQYQLDDGWTSVSFVRPAHGLVALHGDESSRSARSASTPAGRRTAIASKAAARRSSCAMRELREAAARRRRRDRRLRRAPRRGRAPAAGAAAAAELAPIDDDALLDEVTALVELPNVLACRFDASSSPCRRNAWS